MLLEKLKRAVIAALRILGLKPPDPAVAQRAEQALLNKHFLEESQARHRALPSATRRAAVLTALVGVPRALASTNYCLSYVDGFLRKGIDARLLVANQECAPFLDDDLLKSDIFIPGFMLDCYNEEFISRVFDQQHFDYVISMGVSSSTITSPARIVRPSGAVHVLSCGESPLVTHPDADGRAAFTAEVRKNFDGMIVVSEHLKSFWISQGFLPEEICVARVPLRDELFGEKSYAEKGIRALYAGNLAHQEIPDLLSIVAEVCRIYPDFQVDIFADGRPDEKSTLQDTLATKGLDCSINIHDALPLAQLADKEIAADLLLLPRRSGEFSAAGFPSKLGEYLMSGTPVVCTAVGDIPTVLPQDKAVLIEPDNPAAFAQGIIEALDNWQETCDRGRHGREWALQNNSSPAVISALLPWLDSLAQRKAEARNE